MIVNLAAFVFTVMLGIVGGWLALLIADMQNTAIGVFINAIEPTALQCIINERNVILSVIGKNPA